LTENNAGSLRRPDGGRSNHQAAPRRSWRRAGFVSGGSLRKVLHRAGPGREERRQLARQLSSAGGPERA